MADEAVPAKPFEFAALEERLKARGLSALEGLAEIVVEETFAWTKESLAIHPNALVKEIGIPAVNVIEPLAKNLVDKIDGKEG